MTSPPAIPFEPILLGDLPPTPVVTIITSNFNYGDYICQAIESVLAQTYPHFEMIVSDDGSTDDSVSHVLHYVDRDDRIKLVCGANAGQAEAWNRAFEASTGQLFCILDSDDAFLPNKIETVVDHFLATPGAGLLVHPMLIVNGEGMVMRQVPSQPTYNEGWIGPQVLSNHGRWEAMPSSALCFRREVAQILFPIPDGVGRIGADGYIMRLAPLLTPVTSVDKPLTRYRAHDLNATRSYGNFRELEKLLKRKSDAANLRAAIQQRLIQAQLSDRIPPQRNSSRLDFWISLLDGSPLRERIKRLVPLVSQTLGDKMDPFPKRLVKVGVFSLCLVAPIEMRASIMDKFFSLTAYYLEPRPAEQLLHRIIKNVPRKTPQEPNLRTTGRHGNGTSGTIENVR